MDVDEDDEILEEPEEEDEANANDTQEGDDNEEETDDDERDPFAELLEDPRTTILTDPADISKLRNITDYNTEEEEDDEEDDEEDNDKDAEHTPTVPERTPSNRCVLCVGAERCSEVAQPDRSRSSRNIVGSWQIHPDAAYEWGLNHLSMKQENVEATQLVELPVCWSHLMRACNTLHVSKEKLSSAGNPLAPKATLEYRRCCQCKTYS